ncbi:bestrophin-3, partial [Hyalella azteca]|uniref:Bestrophin homolog n=1 Tax=Hyalella azteca TaxID=294128 RepID=A0A8B7NR49_HYAAZ
MTVTYTAQVATSSHGLGCFWKLLFRWKGSIYKLVWHELLIYCLCYFTISLIYRLALTEPQKRTFEGIALHIEEFTKLIPMAFVLGFYVSIVMTRWWDQYNTIPFPSTVAVFVSFNIRGQTEETRVLRRTILRYVCLSFALTMSMISPPVKKRFPTMTHLVNAGLLTEQEQMIFDIIHWRTGTPKYWLPLVWAGAVVTKARKQGKIKDDFALNTIMNEITNFRRGCHSLLHYDYICVPLVYTQVVTLSVYTFFVSTMIGRQFLEDSQDDPGRQVDMYVPWFTILQFVFYMGWLKVAESLINPFGEDDDDFEVNAMVDKNLQTSYLIVDEMHEDHPELIKDMYFEEVVPAALPYTVASEQYRANQAINHGSTAELKVPEPLQEIM